eukprot:GHVL01014138.1.p1 GENE.GHVL01014138.1~~GHVL01014138.1.p1  ORF type:complete len:329 (+),score=42.29 GHVL01014138.1:42-1028(+)
MKCIACNIQNACVRRATSEPLCKECFFDIFEDEVHETIMSQSMFNKGERIALAVSGGKDSSVLVEVMTKLNKDRNYCLELFLLAIDEGIVGYRDDSLLSVKKNQEKYNLPLEILSFADIYGVSMDQIVSHVGLKNNCTFCGVFRRQSLERGAMILEAHKLATGHNADDCAETILMNVLRGDIARLGRNAGDVVSGRDGKMPRCKPLGFSYQKDIVMYAHFKKLDYFSTECKYSPNAYRGNTRDLIKQLEISNRHSILDIIHSAQHMKLSKESTSPAPLQECQRCGFPSSNAICKACVLLEGLKKGEAKAAVSNSKKIRKAKLAIKVSE